MKKLLPLLTILAAMTAFPAFALDFHQARDQGIIGERADGYVEPIQPSADVRQLASDINAKRKAEYEAIAKDKNQPVDTVAKLAAQQIISGLPAGSAYQAADGSWKKR
jgi:uncharacterized protein YdbL (DUF1318 family)